MPPPLLSYLRAARKHSCKFANRGQVGTGAAADPESAAGPWVAPELAAGQVGRQAGKEARAQASQPSAQPSGHRPGHCPPLPGLSQQSLESLLSMLNICGGVEEVLVSLQGRSAVLLAPS